MRPSIARVNEQLDLRRAASRHPLPQPAKLGLHPVPVSCFSRPHSGGNLETKLQFSAVSHNLLCRKFAVSVRKLQLPDPPTFYPQCRGRT